MASIEVARATITDVGKALKEPKMTGQNVDQTMREMTKQLAEQRGHDVSHLGKEKQ